MKTKLKMWGNSLGVRIPKTLSDDLGLSTDREVIISRENNTLSITPVTKEVTLEGLLQQITPDNIPHTDFLHGNRQGNELW